VREHEPRRTGSFLLAPYPVTLDEEEFGLCDDLPASVTMVRVPHRDTEIIPHQTGRVIVTGTLSVAAHAEASGRVFLVGLATDFCVCWSALDARKVGLGALVVEDACRGIDTGGSLGKAWAQMKKAGVKRMQSADLQTA